MSVLDQRALFVEDQVSLPRRLNVKFASNLICCSYLVLVALLASRHEPWADEAQAWLIARDSSWWTMWTRIGHQEGTPMLWHSLLHVFITAGIPFWGMGLLSTVAGLCATLLITRSSPLPLILRCALPFTYFLAYQYAVVARSYSLIPPLLFACVVLYRRSTSRKLLVCFLLLLAAVSAQGFLFSVALSITLLIQELKSGRRATRQERLGVIATGVLFTAAIVLLALSAWPNSETTFARTANWSWANFVGMSRYAFEQGFGTWWLAVLLILLSLPLMFRGPGWIFFAVSSVSLCVFGSVVYFNVWHSGMLVLAWLAGIWLSYDKSIYRLPALVALFTLVAIQITWTGEAACYDWNHAYSGSRAMALELSRQNFQNASFLNLGFPTVALKPYLPRTESVGSYWQWSSHDPVNDAAEQLGTLHPDIVVVGYSSPADQRLWSFLVSQSGYHLDSSREGQTFWRTRPFQPENFDLYKRGIVSRNTALCPQLDFRAPLAAPQLLWGFDEKESQAGLAVGSAAGLVLQRPERARTAKLVRLTAELDVTSQQFRSSGPLQLTFYVAGKGLEPILINRAGTILYQQELKMSGLFSAIVPVALRFERARKWSDVLPAQFRAVVRRIGLKAL